MTKYYGHFENNNLIGVVEVEDTVTPEDNNLVLLQNWTGWTKSPSPHHVMRYENGSATWVDPRSQTEKTSTLTQEVLIKRNKLLTDSDWIVVRALDMGNPVPQDWKTYRQQLRDITNQVGFPQYINWPDIPQ